MVIRLTLFPTHLTGLRTPESRIDTSLHDRSHIELQLADGSWLAQTLCPSGVFLGCAFRCVVRKTDKICIVLSDQVTYKMDYFFKICQQKFRFNSSRSLPVVYNGEIEVIFNSYTTIILPGNLPNSRCSQVILSRCFGRFP